MAFGLTAVPARLRRRWRGVLSAPLLVLLYHRVVPHVGRDRNRLAVSRANFAAHLSWLRAHTDVLDESAMLVQLQRRRRSRRPRVLITFDDGYADVITQGLPILKEYGCPATLFVTSDAVGSQQPFWWDLLEGIVDKLLATGDREHALRQCAPLCPADLSQISSTDVYSTLHGALQRMPAYQRLAVLTDLAATCHIGSFQCTDGRPVTWTELRTWLDVGMSIGAHTRTHGQLSALTDEEVLNEIHGSQESLESKLHCHMSMFAYPFGATADFDQRAENAVRRAGFRCAFANRPGNVRWARNLFALPRYLVRDWPAPQFAQTFEGWCR